MKVSALSREQTQTNIEFDRKLGKFVFGELTLSGWDEYQNVVAKVERAGYAIEAKSENDEWSRFEVNLKEEGLVLYLVFNDAWLELINLHSNSDGDTTFTEMYRLAKRLGLKDGDYPWGWASISEGKMGGYSLTIGYVRRSFISTFFHRLKLMWT